MTEPEKNLKTLGRLAEHALQAAVQMDETPTVSLLSMASQDVMENIEYAGAQAGSHEMALHHLSAVEGRSEEDLVVAILRALDIARSCQSATTIDLLKTALLNEGLRLAATLSREDAAPAAPGGSSSLPRLNSAGAERATGRAPSNLISRSARPRAARPGRSLVPDRGRPGVCGTHLSIEGPAPSANPTARASSTVTGRLLSSFPTGD